MNKITYEEFMERVREKHGDNFSIAEADFVTMRHPLRIFCKSHQEYIDTHAASHVTYHNPCKKCVREKKFENYVPKVLEAMRHNFPDLELISDITDFNCEVILKCPKHGEFKTTADRVIYNGTGCTACGRDIASQKATGTQRVSFDEFKQRFAERYGSKLSLISDEQDYENFNSLLTVKCSVPEHAEFQNTAKDLLRYHGCKNCKESMGERLVRIALEALDIAYEQEKRFASCRDRKELPFDFWLPDFSTLIEFQGKQHEVSAERFGGVKALRGTQKRDKIKKDWASENGINLIYIYDYTDVKKTILENLKPTNDYNPSDVLEKINEKEAEWNSEKWNEHLKKLIKKHGSNYDFSKTKWSMGQKDISYICPEHGERIGNLHNLLKGHGCSLCAKTEMTLEQVIERSRLRFGDKFDFTNSSFGGMGVKMEFTCREHGLIKITPENHFWLSQGCKLCSNKADNGSPEKFLKKAKEKFGDRFDYSDLNYINTANKVTIRCIKHDHIFPTLPGDHIRYDTGACEYCVKEFISSIKSKSITVEGIEYQSITAAAEHYGLKGATVRKRMKSGWEVDRAFTTPLKS